MGAFTFGGGYAMLPIIEDELVQKNCWIEKEQFVDCLAVAQSGPGAVAVNTAIFTGYKVMGPTGSLVATLGVVLPSFLIIASIAATLAAAGPSPLLTKFFMGIRPAVTALILSAAVSIAKVVLVDKLSWSIAVLALAATVFVHAHPALIIVAAALYGVLRYTARRRRATSS